MEERPVHTGEVAGSIPAGTTDDGPSQTICEGPSRTLPPVKSRAIPGPLLVGAAVSAVVAVAMAVWMTVMAGFPAAVLVSVDVEVYRAGGRAVLHGLPLYGPTAPGSKLPFTYAPFAAVVFAPLAWLPASLTAAVGALTNLASAGLVIAGSMTVLGYRRDRRLALFTVLAILGCYLLQPLSQTFWLGQINLILMAVVLADLLWSDDRWRGVGVGIAAAIKLTPLIFVGYLLVTRQWRTAATALVTFAVALVVAVAALGGQAARYWTGALLDSGRIGAVDGHGNNSINGLLSQLLRVADVERYARLGDGGTTVFAAPTWMWLAVAGPAAIAGFWVAALAHRRGRELFAVTLTGLTGCAVSPFSWGHHWVWVLPLLLIAVDWAWRTTDRERPLSRLRWAAPALIVLTVFPYPWTRGTGRWTYSGISGLPRPAAGHWYTYPVDTVLAGHYSLLWLAVVIAGFVAYRTRDDLRSVRVAR